MTPKKSNNVTETVPNLWTSKIEKIIAKSLARDILNSYQDWLEFFMRYVEEVKMKILLTLDWRDSAWKWYNSKKITEFLNPKSYRINTFWVPTEEDQKNRYERYKKCFPKNWQLSINDRSRYNRALVEPVMWFCNPEQYEEFMLSVNEFEKSIINDYWIILLKFYLSIPKHIQRERLIERILTSRKEWKMSPVDKEALDKWDLYTYWKYQNLKNASNSAPWHIIKSSIRESVNEIIKIMIMSSQEAVERVQNEMYDYKKRKLDYLYYEKLLAIKWLKSWNVNIVKLLREKSWIFSVQVEELLSNNADKQNLINLIIKEFEVEVEKLEQEFQRNWWILDLTPNKKLYTSWKKELIDMEKSWKIWEPFDFHKYRFKKDEKSWLWIEK